MSRTWAVNYALYQAGWIACVLGASAHAPWTGAAVAAALAAVHLALTRERALELRLMGLAVGLGAINEYAQLAQGTYRFTSGMLVDGLAPAWLLAMWAQFATTFRYSLRGVMLHPGRAVLFGAAGGPIAFLAGERLGAVSLLPPLSGGLVRLSVAWALALAVLSVATRRMGHGALEPTYRIDAKESREDSVVARIP